MQGRHPRESEAMIAELMMPQHANIMGNVFGGVLLAMVDRVAAVAAIRHARRPAVTVSVDKVDFREPIRVGELVTAMARVNFTGRTSMEVGVKVIAENVLTGERRHTNSCYITYVALTSPTSPLTTRASPSRCHRSSPRPRTRSGATTARRSAGRSG